MMNLFKMDLHRFLTNKIMYILLVVFIAFQIFGIFMIKQYEQPVEQGGMLISHMNESQFIQQMLAQTPSWVLIYVTVFSVYFYMSEYNAGFYKNYISMKRARMYSVLSKIVILGLFTLLMMLVMVVADLIGRAIFFQQATLGALGYLSTLLAGQFLLHWAFSIVILSLTMILKSMLTSIVTGIILALNVFGMAVGALESLFTDLNVSAYLLVNTIVRIKDFNQLSDVIHVFSVAIAFILLFSCIAIRYKMKEDLK
ncbi:hypothetical protein [Shouchella patagoniensis]|uniref:hypothetical protein n=1 Tax=Shouchella patagoniensis TaxID=228576 RepID=UPI0009959781|nr:hypothetical protein [Shouchella patagoniensis]